MESPLGKVIKMNEYEIIEPQTVSIEPRKTIIKKGFHTEPSVFNWNTFSFQPVNSNISIDAMEENTVHELLKLVGLENDYCRHVMETRRRLKLMLQRIVYTEWGADYYPFSKESLMYLTSYVDAMSNTLGYDYHRCLDEDASLLIPGKLIHNQLDVNEFLQPLFTYKFRFDLVAKAVMSGLPEEAIRSEVERIIYQGLV